MGHDVFVSHSAKDKVTADAVCAVLESKGIRCWVAPRDITPGKDWGESIIEAIKGARVMVLIFSTNANNSPQIKREVERAVNKGIPVIPLRIEDVVPTASLEYFLSTPHWLDAFTPPLEKHLQHLAQVVQQIVDVAGTPVAATLPSPPPVKGALPGKNEPTRIGPAKRRKSKTVWLAAAALLTLSLGFGGWYFSMHLPAENLRKAKQAQMELEQKQKEAARQQQLAEEKRQEAEKEHLANARGFASIKTIPAGANVVIDSEPVQQSPALFKSLKLGKHDVSITMDGYESFTGEVEIKENDVATLDHSLVRSKGTLALKSTPNGINYSLTGGTDLGQRNDLTGTTPATIENLPTGDYQVEFQRDGWPSATKEIRVERNATAKVEQQYVPGTVEVTSEPSGASVLQNGSLLGVTPLTVTNLPPGEIGFELQMAGYSSTNITGMVKTGGKIVLKAGFAPGTVEVTSEPTGASVLQNGKTLGNTPLTLKNLPPGQLSLELQMAGYSPTNVVGTVRGGETVTMAARLHQPVEDFIGKWDFLHSGSRMVIKAAGIDSECDFSEDFFQFKESADGELVLAESRTAMTMTINSGITKGSSVVSEMSYPPGEVRMTTKIPSSGGGMFGMVAAAASQDMTGTISYTTRYLPEKNMVSVSSHSVIGATAVDKQEIYVLDSTKTKLVLFRIPVGKQQLDAMQSVQPPIVNWVTTADQITDDLINRAIQAHMRTDASGYVGEPTYAVKVSASDMRESTTPVSQPFAPSIQPHAKW
jgi:hypothetical protein